jgi:hypothetical protein
MPLDDRNKLNRLEDLKSKLFSKDYQTKIEHRDVFSYSQRKEVPDSWANTNKNDFKTTDDKFLMKTSFFKKFFIFSMFVFVVALGYAGYVFFIGGNTVSNDNIDISVIGNNFTAGGQELPLVVGITNRNSSQLQLADLVMQYPKGSSSDSSSDTENFRESLGTIPAGAVVNENLTPIIFGEEGSTRTIKISLEYRVAGSNAIFVKDKLYDVTINSTPINLSVDAPTSVSPNQSITLNVKATLNSTTAAPGILAKVDYPIGFQFISSIPAPSFGNNVWNLGDLAPGSEHDVSITGKMVDVTSGDQKIFNVSSGSQSDTDKSVIGVVFNSMQQTVTVQKPFVEADLFINGVTQGQYASDTKTPIHAEIHYANNLDTKVDDLQIQAKISGNAYDSKSISADQGFYDSSQNTITWDKSSVDSLAELNPGDTGVVDFTVSPLSLFSASGGMLSSPSINIEVDVSGKQSQSGFADTEINNSSSATINIISDVGFSAKALYYSGPFKNTGPIPPEVEKTTTYTIVWTLSNTANNISNAEVTSSLPTWMTYIGNPAPASEDLTYNSDTKQIVWNVERIPAGTGITSASRSVSFQVSLSPSLSQVGAVPIIINDAVLTGHDEFANVDIKVDKGSLTSDLTSDPSFPDGGGLVAQ